METFMRGVFFCAGFFGHSSLRLPSVAAAPLCVLCVKKTGGLHKKGQNSGVYLTTARPGNLAE
jgi:hypothetical protein